MKIKKILISLGVMGTVLALGAGDATDTRGRVSVSDINSKVVLVGVLGKPMGTYVTVEGDYYGPAAMIRSGLEVDKVDGEPLKGITTISNFLERTSKMDLKAGERYRLRGYETGAMSGWPDDPKNPPTDAELRTRQSVNYAKLSWSVSFCVTGIENLGAVKK